MPTTETTSEAVLPVAKGDWVESISDHRPRVARVVDSYWDREKDGSAVCIMDIALYSQSGNCIGRESPSMGGPRRCEPYITYTGEWVRIKKPDFPYRLEWVEAENRFQTDVPRREERVVEKKSVKRSAGRSIPKPTNSDYDPELEVRSRRMAAQQLRDINKADPSPALLDKATKLEEEADRIAAEYGIER